MILCLQGPESTDGGHWLEMINWLATNSTSMLADNSYMIIAEEDFSIASPLEGLGSHYGQWLTFWTVIPKGFH